MTGDVTGMDMLKSLEKYEVGVKAAHKWTFRCDHEGYTVTTKPMMLAEVMDGLRGEYFIAPSETGRIVVIPIDRIDAILSD